jgi:hypothetical protein
MRFGFAHPQARQVTGKLSVYLKGDTFMSDFGQVALVAADLSQPGRCGTPRAAWDQAAGEILATKSLKEKNCPRATYLSLCQMGWIRGVPEGRYTRARENLAHVVAAVRLLVLNPDLAALEPRQLWKNVVSDHETAYNDQMDVVLALWRQKRIDVDRVRQSCS